MRLRLQVCGSETDVGFWHARLDGVDYAFLDHPAFSHWAGERSTHATSLLMLAPAWRPRQPCIPGPPRQSPLGCPGPLAGPCGPNLLCSISQHVQAAANYSATLRS